MSFRITVHLPPSYRYYATPGVKYRTVERRDATGKAHSSGRMGKVYWTGDWYAFTAKGDTAVLEQFSADNALKNPGMSDSSAVLVRRTVFWQPVPGTDHDFLFVSHTGFVTVDGTHQLDLDSAPDNIIEDRWDEESGRSLPWIWRNGKRKRFPCTPPNRGDKAHGH